MSRRSRVLSAVLGGSRFSTWGSSGGYASVIAEFGDEGNASYVPIVNGSEKPLTSVESTAKTGSFGAFTINLDGGGGIYFTDGGTNNDVPASGTVATGIATDGTVIDILIMRTPGLQGFDSITALNAAMAADVGVSESATEIYYLKYGTYDMATAAPDCPTPFDSVSLTTPPNADRLAPPWFDYTFDGGYAHVRRRAGDPRPTLDGDWGSVDIGSMIFDGLNIVYENQTAPGYFNSFPSNWETVTNITDNGDGTVTMRVSGQGYTGKGWADKKLETRNFSGDWAAFNTASPNYLVCSEDSANFVDYRVTFDASSLPTWVQGTHGGQMRGLKNINGDSPMANVGSGGGAHPLRFTDTTFNNKGKNADPAYWPTVFGSDGQFTWVICDNSVVDGALYGFRGQFLNLHLDSCVLRNVRWDILSTFTAYPKNSVVIDANLYGRVAISSITAAYPPTVTTSTAHGLVEGDSIVITDTNANFLGANSGTVTDLTQQGLRKNSAYFVGGTITSTTFQLYEGGQYPFITADGASDFNTAGGAGNHYVAATAHGFNDNNKCIVHGKSGGSVDTALTDGGEYWPVNLTADTFQLSLTQDGAAIDFNGDGSGDIGIVMKNGTRPEERSPVDADGALGWIGANAPNNDGYVYGPIAKRTFAYNCVMASSTYDVGIAVEHADLLQGGSANNIINQETALARVYGLGATDRGPGRQGTFLNGGENDATLGSLHIRGSCVWMTDVNQVIWPFWLDYGASFGYGVVFRAPIGGSSGASMSIGGEAAPENINKNVGLPYVMSGGDTNENHTQHPDNMLVRGAANNDISILFEDSSWISEITRGAATFYGPTDDWTNSAIYDSASTLEDAQAHIEARLLPAPDYEIYGIYGDPASPLFPHWWMNFYDGATLSIDDFDNAPSTTKLAHGVISYRPDAAVIGVGETIFGSDAAQPVIHVELNSSNQIVVEAYGSGGIKDWSVILSSYALSAGEEVLIIWDFNVDTGGTGLKVTMRDATDGSALASGTDGTLGTLAPVSQGTYSIFPDGGLGSALTYLYVDMEARLDFTDADYLSNYIVDSDGLKPPAYHLWAQRDLNGEDTTPDIFLFGVQMLGTVRQPGTVSTQVENPPSMPVGKFDKFAADGGAWTKSGDGHVFTDRVISQFTNLGPTETDVYVRNSTQIDIDATFPAAARWGTFHYGSTTSATKPDGADLKAGTGITGKSSQWMTAASGDQDETCRIQATVDGVLASTQYYQYGVVEAPDGTLGDVIEFGGVTTPAYTTVWQGTTDDTNLEHTGEFFASATTSDKIAFAVAVSPDSFGAGNMGGTLALNTGNFMRLSRGSDHWSIELDRIGGGIATLDFDGITYVDQHRYLIYGCMDSSASGSGWVVRIVDLDDPTVTQEVTDSTNNYVVELEPAGATNWVCVGGTGANDMIGRVAFVYWADVLADIDDLQAELYQTIDGKGWLKDPTDLQTSIGDAFVLTVGADFQTGVNQGNDGNGASWDTVNGTFTTVTNGDILLEQA